MGAIIGNTGAEVLTTMLSWVQGEEDGGAGQGGAAQLVGWAGRARAPPSEQPPVPPRSSTGGRAQLLPRTHAVPPNNPHTCAVPPLPTNLPH